MSDFIAEQNEKDEEKMRFVSMLTVSIKGAVAEAFVEALKADRKLQEEEAEGSDGTKAARRYNATNGVGY